MEDISSGNHYSTMNAKNEENMYDFPKNSKGKYDINIFINMRIYYGKKEEAKYRFWVYCISTLIEPVFPIFLMIKS